MINCNQCKHYFITYNTHTPMGCRAFGFESKKLPCKVIKDESGEECKLFEAKNKASSSKSSNLDDDRNW